VVRDEHGAAWRRRRCLYVRRRHGCHESVGSVTLFWFTRPEPQIWGRLAT
jgi:hypothetical protein